MILQVEEVSAGYGEIEILHGISLSIAGGQIACIIGPNGSGKSTLFRTIMGFVHPKAGRILFEGKPISGLAPHQLIYHGLTCVLQGRTAFAEMTVQENIELGGYAIRKDKAQFRRNMDQVVDLFPILKEKRSARAGLLSGGQQQMLEMARALMLNPRLLLLDEPTIGLSPRASAEIFAKIKDLSQQGLTVVLIEQNAQKVLEIANRAFVLDLGKIRMTGTGVEILENEQVRKLYLGAA